MEFLSFWVPFGYIDCIDLDVQPNLQPYISLNYIKRVQIHHQSSQHLSWPAYGLFINLKNRPLWWRPGARLKHHKHLKSENKPTAIRWFKTDQQFHTWDSQKLGATKWSPSLAHHWFPPAFIWASDVHPPAPQWESLVGNIIRYSGLVIYLMIWGGFLKYGVPKSPWVSILSYGSSWLEWLGYSHFRKLPYVFVFSIPLHIYPNWSLRKIFSETPGLGFIDAQRLPRRNQCCVSHESYIPWQTQLISKLSHLW